MSEGYVHTVLVQQIVEHFRAGLGAHLDLMLIDVPGTRSSDKPPRIGRYTPDVWAKAKREIYIGEAKTAADIDTPHTRAQLSAFLEHIALSPKGSHFTLAVPAFIAAHARMLVSEITTAMSVDPNLWTVLRGEATRP